MNRIHPQSCWFGANATMLYWNLVDLATTGDLWPAVLAALCVLALAAGWIFMGEEASK